MKKNDEEMEEENKAITEAQEAVKEAHEALFVELPSPSRFTSRQVKEKPCVEEMRLFSDCLVKGENCSELEERYFECMEKAFCVCSSDSCFASHNSIGMTDHADETPNPARTEE